MKHSIFLLLLLLSPLLMTAGEINFYSDLSSDELAQQMIDTMSYDELLGQTLMLGYRGERADQTILDWITEKHIGGIKIFGWNGNNLPNVALAVSEMQRAAATTRLATPLVVATDQEGGWVRHVKGNTTITPGNLSLGASGLPQDSYETGKILASELKSLGINMNLAPTVDVYINPLADVIGPRAFSDDPVQSGILGTAFFKGMDDLGVMSSAKHFPGHGNADEDSHGTLPIIPSTKAFWEANDAIPYDMMFREGIPSILVSHLAFPEITGDNTPASQSSIFLKDILRDEMGFEGVVVTDDLVMGGAFHSGITLPEVCELSMRAGSDFLMVSRTPERHDEIWDHLRPLMDSDPTFLESVRVAAKRIIKMKADYLKEENMVPLYPDEGPGAADIPAKNSEDFVFNQTFRSVTTIKQTNVPIQEDSSVLLVSMFYDFRRQGDMIFKDSSNITIPYNFSTDDKWDIINDILLQAEDNEYVLFCLSRYADLRILKELESIKDQIIVISALTPVYLRETIWIKDAIAVYGTGADSFLAGLSAVRGDFIPYGKLPVKIDGFQN